MVWSLAGSDSSAGAGVEADLRAFRCLGARGCAVVTALTAQSTTGVEAVLETPAVHVAATIAALEADLPPAAVKTGALGGAGAARAVAAFLRRAPPGCKIVVDPVVVSTSGRRLLDEAGEAVLVEEILPRADVVCPNAPEAEALLGLPPGSVASPARAPPTSGPTPPARSGSRPTARPASARAARTARAACSRPRSPPPSRAARRPATPPSRPRPSAPPPSAAPRLTRPTRPARGRRPPTCPRRGPTPTPRRPFLARASSRCHNFFRASTARP